MPGYSDPRRAYRAPRWFPWDVVGFWLRWLACAVALVAVLRLVAEPLCR